MRRPPLGDHERHKKEGADEQGQDHGGRGPAVGGGVDEPAGHPHQADVTRTAPTRSNRAGDGRGSVVSGTWRPSAMTTTARRRQVDEEDEAPGDGADEESRRERGRRRWHTPRGRTRPRRPTRSSVTKRGPEDGEGARGEEGGAHALRAAAALSDGRIGGDGAAREGRANHTTPTTKTRRRPYGHQGAPHQEQAGQRAEVGGPPIGGWRPKEGEVRARWRGGRCRPRWSR